MKAMSLFYEGMGKFGLLGRLSNEAFSMTKDLKKTSTNDN